MSMGAVLCRWHAARLLLLAALMGPDHQATTAAPECELDVGTTLLNVSLARCLQRCRDATSDCAQVAYHESRQQCAIGVAASPNETGWILHSLDSAACGYGRGRASVSSSCQICQAGTASHAEVGDLAGAWSLMDANTGADEGYLEVTRGGLATYSSGEHGQFVLFHTRSDLHYPGAFFLEHQGLAVAAGRGAGWEYAWLEDDVVRLLPDGSVVQQPRLTVRRFCGEGPGVCPEQLSPEGSPFFLQTLHGHLAAQADKNEADCQLLEGPTADAGSTEGPCCTAAAAIETMQDENYKATISVLSDRWEDVPLVAALWNKGDDTAAFYTALLGLQGTEIRAVDDYLDLCPSNRSIDKSALNKAVALARRGGCTFAQKIEVAQEAGAMAVLIVNDERDMLQHLSLDPGVQAPQIPAWKMENEVGEQIIAALVGTQGIVAEIGRKTSGASLSSLRDLCCPVQCRARLARASDAGRTGVPDMPGVCVLVDCSVALNISSSADDLPSSSGTCSACPSGMAATVAGLANCGRCGDGATPSAGRSSCEPCSAGRAGTGGRCSQCSSGLQPDSLRRQCVTPPPAPSPTQCTPTTGTGGSNSNNANNANSGSASTSPQFAFATKPPTATDMEGGDGGDGFPWVTIVIVLCVVVLLCLCGWFCIKATQHYAQHAPEGSAIGTILGSVVGGGGTPSASTDDSDEEDEEGGAAGQRRPVKSQGQGAAEKHEGAAEKREDNKGPGRAAAKDNGDGDKGGDKSGGKKGGGDNSGGKTGGAPTGAPKSIQVGGIRVNFS